MRSSPGRVPGAARRPRPRPASSSASICAAPSAPTPPCRGGGGRTSSTPATGRTSARPGRWSRRLTAHDRAAYDARLRRLEPRLRAGLGDAYGEAADAIAERALALAAERFARRPLDLRLQDLRRAVDADWFQQPSALG